MRRGLLLLGLAFVFVLVGCKKVETPSSVATKFYEALAKNDMAALQEVATPQTVQTMAMLGEKMQGMVQAYGKISSTTEKIEGDVAVVTLTFENEETQELTLRKIDDKWKVAIDKE
jgi:hypothetical protein